MRNLYSKLNIDPSASAEEIRSAIDNCPNASLRADASEVLLDSKRRQIYDQLNSVLIDIGYLRAELGLSHADNWQGEEAREYTKQSSSPRSLYEDFVNKIKEANRQKKFNDFILKSRDLIWRLFCYAAVIAIFVGVIVFLQNIDNYSQPTHGDSTHSQTASSKPDSAKQVRSQQAEEKSAPPKPETSDSNKQIPVKRIQKPDNIKSAFTESPLPLPKSKTTRMHTSKRAIAPLKVETSSDGNYFIKLEDSSTEQEVMDFFIRGGDTVEVDVPLGSYIIEYAYGSTWYGYEHYFGPNTRYNRAEHVFHFKRKRNQVTGYTLTLYRVMDGNLRTEDISPDQF